MASMRPSTRPLEQSRLWRQKQHARGAPPAEAVLDDLQCDMEGSGRAADVFVGVDVWGRNTAYAGGSESDQPVRQIVSRGFSCGLFAPGACTGVPEGVTGDHQA